MNMFSITIFSLFYSKFFQNEDIFATNPGKSAAAAAAAEKGIGLHL
jgi:hypothetical protein